MAPTTGNWTSPSGCHVKGDVCCRPAVWTDVAKFFIANYLTHAFTVISTPGARKRDTIIFTIWALFMPFAGVGRAFGVIARCAIWWKDKPSMTHRAREISRCAIWTKDDLNIAHKAGALYTLVKITKGADGKIRVEPNIDKETLDLRDTHFGLDYLPVHVQGRIPTIPRDNRSLSTDPPLTWYYPVQLPFDYTLSHIPTPALPPTPRPTNSSEIAEENPATQNLPEEEQSPNDENCDSIFTLSNSYGVLKACVAIFQVFYGSWELYYARGSQLERYGYAAPSLTVVPYIAMSILNLLAAIVEPQYPCVFLVKHGEDVPLDLRDKINRVMEGAVAVGTASPKDGALQAEKDSPDSAGHPPSSARDLTRIPLYRELLEIAYNARLRSQLSFGKIFRRHVNSKAIWLVVFATALAIGAFSAPYVVARTLTRFRKQQSTQRQRGAIQNWLLFGVTYGIFGLFIRPKIFMRPKLKLGYLTTAFGTMILLGMFVGFGIKMWVEVAEMILEGGVCNIM